MMIDAIMIYSSLSLHDKCHLGDWSMIGSVMMRALNMGSLRITLWTVFSGILKIMAWIVLINFYVASCFLISCLILSSPAHY